MISKIYLACKLVTSNETGKSFYMPVFVSSRLVDLINYHRTHVIVESIALHDMETNQINAAALLSIDMGVAQ